MEESFRLFLLNEICERLEVKDVEKLRFVHKLNIDSTDPMVAITELEKLNKFSSSNVKALATILDNIGRKDWQTKCIS